MSAEPDFSTTIVAVFEVKENEKIDASDVREMCMFTNNAEMEAFREEGHTLVEEIDLSEDILQLVGALLCVSRFKGSMLEFELNLRRLLMAVWENGRRKRSENRSAHIEDLCIKERTPVAETDLDMNVEGTRGVYKLLMELDADGDSNDTSFADTLDDLILRTWHAGLSSQEKAPK